jgi:uncharacterized PurR-regulated membrane protein YhhQ (DUF165 family)
MLRIVTRDQAKPEDYMAVVPTHMSAGAAAVTSPPKVSNFSISVAVVSTVVAAVVAAWNVVVYQRLRRSCISDSVAHGM